MISRPSAPRSNASAAVALAHTSDLTPEEWALILEALSIYQHHGAFRALYGSSLTVRLTPDTSRLEAA